MADNFARKERKNQYRSTDPIGERRRVKNLIKQGREEGMTRGDEGGVSGGAGATGSWDSHVEGRDPSLDKEDRQAQAFKQYEQDVFMKNGETEDSTAVTVREKSIGLHTAEGNVGINISSKGNITSQGKIILKVSGSEIVKGDYTENSLSFINMTGIGGYPPHTHDLQAAYLFRWPGVQLVSGIDKMLEEFTKLG